MGALRTIGTIILMGASGLGGYLAKSNDVNGFSLQNQEQQTILYSEELGKGYQLTQMSNEIYIGNAEHQYNGLRELINYELIFGDVPFTGMFTPEESTLDKLVKKAEDLF